MNDHTRYRIDTLEHEDTRRSKKAATRLRNGAFAAYLEQTSIHKQLALACIKCPSATVHTLLQAWIKYMRSPEHEKEKSRSRKINSDDEEAVNEKRRQVQLKLQVHSLRHQLRMMKRQNAVKNNPREWATLQKQLQDLTLQHGYGKLPSDGRILQPRYDLLS